MMSATDYAIRTITGIVNKPVASIEFLLNKRIIKINTLLLLNGFPVCITGKANSGRVISVSCFEVLKLSTDNEQYIKKLESFENKAKKNANIVYDEKYDGISSDKNIELYDTFIKKLNTTIYYIEHIVIYI